MTLTIEQAEAWGKWLAYAFPRLADNEHNGSILAQHIQDTANGVWSEYAVRQAIFVNKRLLQWLPEDIYVEDPNDVLARQQTEAAQKKADAEAAQAEVARKAALTERRQQKADEEWKNTHRDLLGKSRPDFQSEHIKAENAKIDDAKQTMVAVNAMVSAGLRREIENTIASYQKINPVTGHVDHSGTAKLRAELRSIKVLNNNVEDLPRTLSMVRQAIKRLP